MCKLSCNRGYHTDKNKQTNVDKIMTLFAEDCAHFRFTVNPHLWLSSDLETGADQSAWSTHLVHASADTCSDDALTAAADGVARRPLGTASTAVLLSPANTVIVNNLLSSRLQFHQSSSATSCINSLSSAAPLNHLLLHYSRHVSGCEINSCLDIWILPEIFNL